MKKIHAWVRLTKGEVDAIGHVYRPCGCSRCLRYTKALRKLRERIGVVSEYSHTHMHVVMGNDYPACVFSTEAAAEEYCKAKTKEEAKQKVGTHGWLGTRIHWRVYSFVLDEPYNP